MASFDPVDAAHRAGPNLDAERARAKREAFDAEQLAREDAAFNDGFIDPDWAQRNPDEASALLSRAQYDDYVNRIQPLIQTRIDRATDDALPDTFAAEARARVSSNNAVASGERALSRSSANLSAAERQALRRRLQLGQSLATVSAGNTTRRSTRDTQLDELNSLNQVLVGVAGNANSALSGAGNQAAARDAAYRQARDQARSANLGLAGAAVGFAVGGPVGAGWGYNVGSRV